MLSEKRAGRSSRRERIERATPSAEPANGAIGEAQMTAEGDRDDRYLATAIDLHRLHELSIWDALVVRAALIAGCRTLYTDDLRHGRRFEALQVVDPFRETPPPIAR